MIVVAIIGILASIAIPAYQDYMTRAKWGKSIAGIAAMKLAVSECLNDHSGIPGDCDAKADLANYGITAYPSGAAVEEATVSLIGTTAAIRIEGTSGLGYCDFDMTPTVDTGAGTIAWVARAKKGTETGAVDLAKCLTFIKGSVDAAGS